MQGTKLFSKHKLSYFSCLILLSCNKSIFMSPIMIVTLFLSMLSNIFWNCSLKWLISPLGCLYIQPIVNLFEPFSKVINLDSTLQFEQVHAPLKLNRLLHSSDVMC